MNVFILIIMLSNSENNFSYTVEFNSKENCVAALIDLRDSYTKNPFAKHFSAYCFKK